MSKENLHQSAYIVADSITGLQWNKVVPNRWGVPVADSPSTIKRRFTEAAGLGVFNKQKQFVVVQLVNPLLLTKMLDDLRGVNLSPDELIDTIQDLLQPE